MKKITAFLALFILLFLIFGCASVTAIYSKDGPEEMKSIEKIFEIPGVSKDELFVRANSWFVDTFKSAESVIQYQDKEAGKIMGKYVFNKTLDVIIIRIKQTISIDVKDEKVRIQISDPFYSTKSVFDTSSTFGEQGELQSKLGLDMANEEWDKLISNLETYLKQDTSW